MIRYGIDLSHHQESSKLPWDKFAGNVHMVIARACYGAELRDRQAVEHIRRGRGIGAKVGLFLFYRPSQPARKQFELFREVAESCRIGMGDIVPALDIERDPYPSPGTDVSPDWRVGVYELVELLDSWCGAKCMPYITQREFRMLGSPQGILDESRPLWAAHYTRAAAPATPLRADGSPRSWTIWQHRVGPFVPNGPGGYDRDHPDLDQNLIAGELPLIGVTPARTDVVVDTDQAVHDIDLEDAIDMDLRWRVLAAQGPILDEILDEARRPV